MPQNRVVSREEWLAQRRAHLKDEKALTRLRDLVAAERRALPWVRIDKDYRFVTAEGESSLADLFGGNSQLVVQHFMFGPDWEAGCPSCSLCADHAEGALVHLLNHDVSYVRVARAPIEKLLAYQKRMGWQAPLVSSLGSDFNFDFGVSFTEEQLKGELTYNYATLPGPEVGIEELPGHSVFYKDGEGAIFHTYSSYARGNEEVIGAFVYLDMTPKGRNEREIMDWVRRHDEYGTPRS